MDHEGTGTEQWGGPKPAQASAPPTVEQVFRDYAPRIYSLALRMLGNEADAEDVTQEVLLQLIRKIDTFRGESAFPTWLHRITVNAALAYRRKRASREQHHVRDPLDSFLEEGRHATPVRNWWVQPDQIAEDRETQRLIEKAIAGLPEIYRDVYVLADVEGLANSEIAEMLGLSVSAVKSRLHRARLLMRSALAPHFEEVPA
jgi:RNA polymerase sigma-70 factor (ECF subfamily)